MAQSKWQEEFIEVLGEEFRSHKERNPRFSVRAFARKIGLSAGSLSDSLRGKKKWNLRPKRAAGILEKLSITSVRKNQLLLRMGELPQLTKKSLRVSDYDILTDWAYYPILFSFDLPEPLASTERIAKRLGLTEERVRAVVSDLLRRGLLVKSETGAPLRPPVFIKTTDGPTNQVIRRHHEVNLGLSAKALAQVPAERRDFTSLTFAGSQEQISVLRDEIRKLYEKASILMDRAHENDAVFRLSIQLFPMEFKE